MLPTKQSKTEKRVSRQTRASTDIAHKTSRSQWKGHPFNTIFFGFNTKTFAQQYYYLYTHIICMCNRHWLLPFPKCLWCIVLSLSLCLSLSIWVYLFFHLSLKVSVCRNILFVFLVKSLAF